MPRSEKLLELAEMVTAQAAMLPQAMPERDQLETLAEQAQALAYWDDRLETLGSDPQATPEKMAKIEQAIADQDNQIRASLEEVLSRADSQIGPSASEH